MNKMDLLNLLEILSQWEGIMITQGKKITDELVNLKLNLEKEILNHGQSER